MYLYLALSRVAVFLFLLCIDHFFCGISIYFMCVLSQPERFFLTLVSRLFHFLASFCSGSDKKAIIELSRAEATKFEELDDDKKG